MIKELIKKLVPERQRLAVRYQLFKLRGLFYRGNAVVCPCCSGHFKCFLPYGHGPYRRENALCPSCHTLERHRALWLYLERHTPIFQKFLKVLHFAPEPVLQERLRSLPNLQYTSADLYSPLAMEEVDIMQMLYPDQSFDVVLCSHVLAHVPDDHQALKELRRVLTPDGILILQGRIHELLPQTIEAPANASEKERKELLGQADRFRNYGLDFAERLKQAGLQVQEIDMAKELRPEELQRFGIKPGEQLYVCSRA